MQKCFLMRYYTLYSSCLQKTCHHDLPHNYLYMYDVHLYEYFSICKICKIYKLFNNIVNSITNRYIESTEQLYYISTSHTILAILY